MTNEFPSEADEPVAWRYRVSPFQLNWNYSRERPQMTNDIVVLEPLYSGPSVGTEKTADLVRDAFYEGRELGPWPRTLTEADKHSAWLGSESRKQLTVWQGRPMSSNG